MKVIFLDFDGVLNSAQEVYWQHRLEKTVLWRRIRAKLSRWTYRPTKWLHEVLEKRGIVKWFSFRNWIEWHLYYFSNHCQFCPIACNNVQEILDAVPDAVIVVSSVWRSWGLKSLRRILKHNGIDPKRVYAALPSRGWGPEITCRGDQIEWWLKQPPNYDPAYPPEEQMITEFVILDDDSDMNRLMPKLVKIDGHTGLTLNDANRAIAILGGKTLWSLSDLPEVTNG